MKLSTLSPRDHELYTRAVKTLCDNVYNDENMPWSPYKCITPGKNVFPGIWNWDSAFHAIGVSYFDVDLSKQSILGFLQFIREDGKLPDVVWEDGRITFENGKPPVFAWACERIYKCCKDVNFLKTVYPHLKSNELYMTSNHCFEGLFFYDAENKESPDYIKFVKYDSGWDNSVRWDDGITEYWAIDLNCFMSLNYRSLAFIANELNLKEECELWTEKGKILDALINEKMWNDEVGSYTDTNRFTGKHSKALSPASFMPLFINIVSGERALKMSELAKTRFGSKMPTAPFDDPAFSNDYWRGPIWLNVAYFAAKGLKNYSFPVANEIRENILDMCYNEKNGIFENYHAISGKGLCCDHFSWSSTFILEFLFNWEE